MRLFGLVCPRKHLLHEKLPARPITIARIASGDVRKHVCYIPLFLGCNFDDFSGICGEIFDGSLILSFVKDHTRLLLPTGTPFTTQHENFIYADAFRLLLCLPSRVVIGYSGAQ